DEDPHAQRVPSQAPVLFRHILFGMAERRTAASRRTTKRGGRTTPKGTLAKGTGPKGAVPKGTVPRGTGPGNHARPASSGRYTPPPVPADAPSPLWVPVLMFGLIGLGVLTILLNYL